MSSSRAAAGIAALLLATATACSASPSPPGKDQLLDLKVPQSVTVSTRTVDGLGQILVDGSGHALYMFPPDAGSRVTCRGACAGTWPPLVIADGRRPSAGAAINSADLATLADPNTGAQVITYLGYPLYRYSGDVGAGTANGQALFSDGGPWYVLDPDGQPVTKDPRSRH